MPDQSLHEKNTDSLDGPLAELLADAVRKLQAGELVDMEALAASHPEYVESLQRLLPTMQTLADLGRSQSGGLTAAPGVDEERQQIDGNLGDFRIIREIGRGGMGVVYEAEQISLKRRVALKVLPFATVMGSQHLQRFQNEAQAAASLKHPNIVQVYAVGSDRGVHHYAMEYVEGQTLEAVVDELRQASGLAPGRKGEPPSTVSRLTRALCEGTLAKVPRPSADQPTQVYRPSHPNPHASPTEETHPKANAHSSTDVSHQGQEYFRSVARLGVQAAQALEHAHQMGVVHRDIKPSNLMVDTSGHLWVTDFGLAMTQTEGNLTMTGDVLGTLRYMSPEQAEGDRRVLDHRTDVYSLGVTLYELLALRPPFDARDRHQLIHQIIDGEASSPRLFNRAIPRDLETIVLKAIAAEPKERYATARLLADDLENFLEDRPIRARRPTLAERSSKWARRHRTVVWAGVATLLIAVGALATSTVMISGALSRERTQRGIAERQHQRAMANLDLALDALDEVYIKAIGEERLLRQPEVFTEDEAAQASKPELSEFETELLQRGLGFYDQFAEQNRDNPEALLTTGKAFYRVALLQSGLGEEDEAEKAYSEAIVRFQRLAEQHPDEGIEFPSQYAAAFRARGGTYRSRGEYEKAIADYNEAIRLDPAEATARNGRAMAYMELERWKEALADLNEAIRLDPNSDAAYHNRGSVYEHLEQPKRALADYDKSLQINAQGVVTWNNLGALYGTLGQYDKAIENLDEAIRIDPSYYAAFVNRGVAYRDKGDLQQALKDFDEALRLNPNSPEALMSRASVYRELGRLQEALADCKRLTEVEPDQADTHLMCGRVYLNLGQFDKALAELNKTLSLDPRRQRALTSRSILYHKAGEFEKALADASEVIRLFPDNATAYWNRASFYLELERREEALADFDEVVRLDPDNSSARNKRGFIYLHMSEFDKALNDFNEALRIEPGKLSALSNRAHIYVIKGEIDKALADCSEMIRRAPESPEGPYTRGSVLAEQGDFEKARGDFEKAFELSSGAVPFRYYSALAALGANQIEEYRATCAKLLETTETAAAHRNANMAHRDANMAAWACILQPDTVEDWSKPRQLAEKVVAERPESGQYATTLGAVLYRSGKFEEALQQLNEAERLAQQPSAYGYPPTYAWYLLAMTHQKLGHDEESANWLKRANAWLDEAIAEMEQGEASLPWYRRLTLEAFRDEAEGMIEAGKVNPAQRDNQPTSEKSEPAKSVADPAAEGDKTS